LRGDDGGDGFGAARCAQRDVPALLFVDFADALDFVAGGGDGGLEVFGGDFVLEAGGKTVYIKSNKFDLKKLEEDKTDIEVELSTSADEEYGDYSLFVKLLGDSKKKTITVDLKKKGQSLVKIESYEELAKMTGIDELDGKKLSSDSYADIMAYMAGIKSDKFIEKLRKTDIPKEYVDILESQLP